MGGSRPKSLASLGLAPKPQQSASPRPAASASPHPIPVGPRTPTSSLATNAASWSTSLRAQNAPTPPVPSGSVAPSTGILAARRAAATGAPAPPPVGSRRTPPHAGPGGPAYGFPVDAAAYGGMDGSLLEPPDAQAAADGAEAVAALNKMSAALVSVAGALRSAASLEWRGAVSLTGLPFRHCRRSRRGTRSAGSTVA